MKAIRMNTANRTYMGNGCEPLPATVVEFKDGRFATEACFELDAAEVEAIMNNKRIYLTFVGQTVIPFMLKTTSIMDKAVQDKVQDKFKMKKIILNRLKALHSKCLRGAVQDGSR